MNKLPPYKVEQLKIGIKVILLLLFYAFSLLVILFQVEQNVKLIKVKLLDLAYLIKCSCLVILLSIRSFWHFQLHKAVSFTMFFLLNYTFRSCIFYTSIKYLKRDLIFSDYYKNIYLLNWSHKLLFSFNILYYFHIF